MEDLIRCQVSRSRLPLVAALALMFALLMPLHAVASPESLVTPPDAASEAVHDAADDCALPRGPDALPRVGDAATDDQMYTLYDQYRHLPGFIDVHHLPIGAAAFTVLFEEAVPQEAHDIAAAHPVAFQAVPAIPAPEPLSVESAAPDLQDVLCHGIRPGARIVSGGAICTLSFLYTDGTRIYASTAGHCISTGASATLAGGVTIGQAVYSTGSGGVGDDFALIEIDASKEHLVDPAMCDYGGPEFIQNGSILGQVVVHTGHGLGYVAAPPRPKMGIGGSYGVRSFAWTGGAVPGDSGSAIQTASGGAMGVVTHIGFGYGLGINFGSRATTALNDAGYGHLTLMTAPMHV